MLKRIIKKEQPNDGNETTGTLLNGTSYNLQLHLQQQQQQQQQQPVDNNNNNNNNNTDHKKSNNSIYNAYNYNYFNDTYKEQQQKYCHPAMKRIVSNIKMTTITNRIRLLYVQNKVIVHCYIGIALLLLHILILRQLIQYCFVKKPIPSPLSTQWIHATNDTTICTELVSSVQSSSSYKYLREALHALDNITEKIMYPNDILHYYHSNNLSFSNTTNNTNTKLIYFITPTVRTKTQIIDLIRLSQTLQHDKYIYWIVIEDRKYCSQRIRTILDRSNLLYAHTSIRTPPYKQPSIHYKTEPSRGVVQRNRGIDIVQLLTNTTYTVTLPTTTTTNSSRYSNNNNNTDDTNTSTTVLTTSSYVLPDGVVYFGDDDNGYDIQLFNEIRLLQPNRIGVFAVAYVGGGYYERCIVNASTGLVDKLISNWAGPKKTNYRKLVEYLHIIPYVNNTRQFTMDMGGYVFSTLLINQYKPKFLNNLTINGFIETTFIQQLNISHVNELQPLVQNCTAIYVYHIKTSIDVHIKHVTKDKIFYSLIELLY